MHFDLSHRFSTLDLYKENTQYCRYYWYEVTTRQYDKKKTTDAKKYTTISWNLCYKSQNEFFHLFKIFTLITRCRTLLLRYLQWNFIIPKSNFSNIYFQNHLVFVGCSCSLSIDNYQLNYFFYAGHYGQNSDEGVYKPSLPNRKHAHRVLCIVFPDLLIWTGKKYNSYG